MSVLVSSTPAPPSRPAEREFTVRSRSQLQLVIRRFLQHKLAVGSLVVFVGLLMISFVLPHFYRWGYGELTPDFSQSPSWSHPMGTDDIGIDEFAQVMRGSQASIEVALLVALISSVLGTFVGAISGYFGGILDAGLMRVVDLVLTVPQYAIAIAIGYNLSSSGNQRLEVALLLAFLSWPSIARVVRAQFLSLREKEYVEAARALGAGSGRIIWKHLIPNAIGAIIVNATITVAIAILSEAALSFLGFGIKPPDTSLGQLVSLGTAAATTRPWVFYFPGVVIILIALTINFIGDGLRDAFDPQQTRVRA